MLVQDGLGALTKDGVSQFGGKAEVEDHFAGTGNHIGGPGSGVDVGDLETGGREKVITLVPFRGGQLRECRRRIVDRVACQMRVGHMPLDSFDDQPGAQ